MTTTWILVAHRGGARLFEGSRANGLQLVEEIHHPEGRLKNGEINSDKPGRAFDKLGGGRHSMSKEHEPKEQVALRFAKHLATVLEKGRTDQRYARLVLVAESRFLGALRAALSPHTAALVGASVDKDLGGVNDHDLASHLAGAVAW